MDCTRALAKAQARPSSTYSLISIKLVVTVFDIFVAKSPHVELSVRASKVAHCACAGRGTIVSATIDIIKIIIIQRAILCLGLFMFLIINA